MNQFIIITKKGKAPRVKTPPKEYTAMLAFARKVIDLNPGADVYILNELGGGQQPWIVCAKTEIDIHEGMKAYPYPGEPPCGECGAMTKEEAEEKCICGGDKDSCHGCHLWPDD